MIPVDNNMENISNYSTYIYISNILPIVINLQKRNYLNLQELQFILFSKSTLDKNI